MKIDAFIMFNFCDACLLPNVECSTVSSEGFEITNLISNSESCKKKGFIAYNSIRPPIDVTFNFMCNIDIYYIIIWPQVGNQKSSGFEISALKSNENNGFRQSVEYMKIGSGTINTEPGIIFCNAVMTNSKVEEVKPKYFASRPIYKGPNWRSVKSVKIKIFKTDKSSLPCLKDVQIWGKVNNFSSDEVKAKVLLLWNRKLHSQKINVLSPVHRSDIVTVCHLENDLKLEEKFEIPEDFLDPITYELMTLPLILPSGKIVDNSTLDKHNHIEANWGRSPNDPFTGKVFTTSSYPVIANSLKSRIDKFLVEHCDKLEVKHAPRTVGALVKGNAFNDKIAFVGDSKSVKRKVQDQKVGCVSAVSLTGTECGESEATGSTIHKKCKFEEVVDDRLDLAIKSSLSGLPSFVQFDKKCEPKKNHCSKCNENQLMYSLPCDHLLCRKCLLHTLKQKLCVCNVCKSAFRSGEAKRVHV